MEIRIPALAAALLLLGCGNAPPSATSGPGGASAGQTGSSASTGASSTTGSVGGSGGADACATKCATEAQLGCSLGSECVDTCESAFHHPADCGPELALYYACYADHAAKEQTCTIPSACSTTFGDYIYCADQLCTTDPCEDQLGVCSCSGSCASKKVKSICTGADCTCFVEGVEVGKCSDGSIPICGLKESCCVVPYFLAK